MSKAKAKVSKGAPPLVVKVSRQDGPDLTSRWQTFNVPHAGAMTVADLLDSINANPRTVDGQPTSPIMWSSACTWPACGVCTILINGKAAPACGTLISSVLPKGGKLTLAPMQAFPVRQDLWVDRTDMQKSAARAEAYCDDDVPLGDAGLAQFSACTRCGACVDACPEANQGAAFMGPYAIGAVHATRLARGAPAPLSLLESGGIAECGHIQNCVETCPEGVRLDRAISAASKAAFKRWLRVITGRD